MKKKKIWKNFSRRFFVWIYRLKKYSHHWGLYIQNCINQKITLIFFSKESNKSVIREWNVNKIVSLIILFLTMLFLSIHYLITYQSRDKFLSQVEEENQKLNLQINLLEERVDTINNYQKKYSEQMIKIYQNFVDIEGESIWEKVARNEDVELILKTWDLKDINWFDSSPKEKFNTLEKINQSRIQILFSIKQLKEIDKYMTLAEKISTHIPTGWPIKNNIGYKTSGFGTRISPFSEKREFHTGVDIAAATGNDLIATADGIVLFSGEKGNFGKVIIIRHDFGYRTIYAHNHVNIVKVGQQVKKNQKIAELGNSGRSTGPHIHYEIRIGKKYVDPWPYIVARF